MGLGKCYFDTQRQSKKADIFGIIKNEVKEKTWVLLCRNL